MNKVYRVIWNVSLGAWVAVSELAKSKTKTTAKSKVGTALALVGAVTVTPNLFAAVGIDGGTGSGTAISGNCANGDPQANTSENYAVAIGCVAQAGGFLGNILDRGNPYNTAYVAGKAGAGVAIGLEAKATGPFGLALGSLAQATASSSIALGVWSQASGDSSLAIGRQSAATGSAAQAIGHISAATGANSLAVGNKAQATANNAVALGNGATAAIVNSVALGAGSVTSALTGNSYLTNQAAPTSNGSVAVGGRRIQNVADGAAAQDAVTVSQLTVVKNTADTAQTTANTAGTKADAAQTTANTAVTNAATADGKAVAAQTAANTAQTTADKGLNFSANGGTADNVKLGETVNFADGTNSKAVYDAATNTYKYNVVDAPVFAGQVRANGFDANNQKVVNVANGTVAANSKDAVNGGQLNTTNQNVTTAQNAANAAQTTANTAGTKADAAQTTANTAVTNAATADGKAVAAQTAANTAQTTADKGLNFSANGGTADNVKLGETVNFADGTNTKAVYDAATNTYKYNIVDAPVFVGQVKANGFDANNQKVINVANGTVAAGSKDAVTGDQLNTTNTNVTTAQTTANTAGTKADAAQTTANTAVTNAATADGKAVAAQATADKGLNFSANGGTADNVKLGETVNFADGTNTKAVYDPATNTYKYNVVDAPVFAGQVKANGFDANNQKVVNVADGVDGKDAVNKGQLDAANQAGGAKTDALGNSTAANLGGGSGYDPVTGAVTAPSYVTTDPTTGTSKTSDNVGDALSSLNTAVNKPLTFKDAGTGSSVNPLGSEFAIVGDSNLTSTVEQGKATLTLNKDLKGLNSVETVDADGNSVVTDGKGTTVTGADGKLTTLTADGTTVTDGTNTSVYGPDGLNVNDGAVTVGKDGLNAGGVTVSKDGINANGTGISNVKDGVDGKDAVNKGQLDAANQAGGAKTDALGNSTAANLGGGSGYDPVTGAITAPSYVTTDPTTGTSKTSDNVGDALSSLNTAVNKPLTFKDAGTGSSVNPLGSEFAIVGDSNLTSTVEQGKATLTLNKDLKGLNSVETVDADGNSVVTDGKGTTVTGADGKLTTLTADGTTVTDGTNTSVYGPDGLNVNDGAVTVGKDGLNAGGVTVSKDGINANGTGISNVKDGVDGKDAVNKGQLDAANQAGGAKTDALGNSTAANLGGGSGYDPVTGAITAPSYVTTDPTTGTSKTSDNVGDALSSLNTAVNKPLTFKDAGTGSSVNPLGSEFAIVGDSNLTTTVSQGQAAIALNKDLKGLNSVETVDADGNSVVTDGKGTTVTGADGKLTTLTADGTTVTDGTDTSVYGPNGLSVNDGAVTVGKDGLNAGGVTVSKDGINANGTGISNVKDGVDGKDAVNKGQLDAANQAGGAKTDALGNSTAANLGGGSGYDPVTGAITAPSYVTTDPTTGTSKTSDNVGDALSSLNTAVNKPLTFKDAGTGSSVNPLGSEFAIVGDSNLTSTVEQGKATLTLNKDLKGLNSVETVDADGNSVVTDGKGTTVTGADGKLTTLTADGTTVTDGTDTSVYGANGLNVNDGAVTVGRDGLNAGGVTVSKDGINANGTGISNVKDGVDGKDAVNVDQLTAVSKAGSDKSDALGNSTAANLGGGSGYDPVTGAITAPSYVTTDPTTGTSKTSDNVGDALSSLNTAVNKPLTFKDAGTGSSVNPLGSEFAIVGDSNLTSTVEQGKATLTLNKDLKGLNSVETVDADGNSVVTDGKGTTVTGADGKLTTLTADGTTVTDGTDTSVYGPDGLNVNDGAVTVGKDGLNAGGVTVSKDGINANGTGISNVKDGVDGKDAVNKGQLDAANQAGGAKTDALGNSTAANLGGGSGYDPVTGAITAPSYVTTDPTTGTSKTSDNVGDALSSLNTAVNKPLTFKDAGTGSSVNPLGSEFAIVGDSNLTTTVSQGQAAIALNKDLKGLNSVETVDADGNSVVTDGKGTTVTGADGKLTTLTADGTTVTDGTNTSVYGPDGLNVNDGAVTVGSDGLNAGGVTVSKDGINANGTGISNVKDGVDGKDAVNKGQLDAANQAGGAKTDALGNSTAANLGGGSGYDPVTGAITAPSYVTTDPTTGTSKTSDNVGDALSSLNTAVNKPLTFKDAGTGSSVNPLGSEFAIVGDSNLTTTVSQGQAAIALNKDLKGLNSVETVDADGNSVVTDGKGTTVTGADGKLTTLTADGTTVTDGTDTSVYGANGLNVNDGAVTVGRDGLNAGGVTVSKDGINANGTGISNVKDGVDGKDAVNVDQLTAVSKAGSDKSDALGQSTAANLGGGAEYDRNTGTVSAPSYTVTSNPNDAGSTTAVNNVGDAISSLNTAVNQPLTFKDAGTGSSVNPLGSEFAIVGDSNLTTTVSQGQAAIALNKDLKGLNSVETVDADGNQTVTNGQGMTVTDKAGNNTHYGADGFGITGSNGRNVTVNSNKVDVGGNTINNVGDAVNDSDAVNKGQMNKILGIDNGQGGAGQFAVTGYTAANSQDQQTDVAGTKVSATAGSTSTPTVAGAVSALNTEINKLQETNLGVKYFRVNSVGDDALASGEDSIAIGKLSQATGDQSISIGVGNVVNGHHSGAIGDPTVVDGNNSYSVGNNNTVATDDTFVLGNDVTETTAGSVVLGGKSAARTGADVDGYMPTASAADQAAITATRSTTGAVAVGDAVNGVYRQITGVAAGTQDSDATNVAQLKAVDNRVTKTGDSVAGILGGGAKVNEDGSMSGPTYNVANTQQTNVGDALTALDTAITNAGNTANAGWTLSANGDATTSKKIKPNSSVNFEGDDNLTVSQTSTADQDGNIKVALNKDLKVDSVTTGNTVINDNGVKVGDTVQVNHTGLLINGGPSVTTAGINAGNRTMTNVADGVNRNDAVNKGQLDNAIGNINQNIDNLSGSAVQYDRNENGVVDKNSITLAGGEEGTKISNVADGQIEAGSRDAINGGQLANVRDNLQGQITNNSNDISNIKNDINSGSVGLVRQADKDAEVTVAKDTGGKSVNVAGTAGERTVTGVAAGAVNDKSTDAVNGSQLNNTNQAVVQALGGGAGYDNITQTFKDPDYKVGNSVYNNVGDAVGALNKADVLINNRIDTLEQAFYDTNRRIHDVEKRANAGIASALAVATLPQPTEKGYTMLSAGTGAWQGESSIAIGASGVTEDKKVFGKPVNYVWKFSGTGDSRGNMGGGAAVGIQWK
ncbi:ESPR-type extended signal peptide-containing protein [Acinetobacter sp. WZC-1]|uniref:ESPR-type extended signal peptide-containing protein n=1 Tax=Acinetobacter sp. WZC-1 TaxID=3459034 RepID=UPI00403E261E